MSDTDTREPSGAGRLLIDIGPLLVFFAVNFFAPVPGVLKIFVATGAFMAAMIAALIYSAMRYRHVSPLLLFSGVMVVVLGGLTIWLQNETFIKVKPTIYYGTPLLVVQSKRKTHLNLLQFPSSHLQSHSNEI